MNSSTPILYSFRRCPYAMRARMALKYSGLTIELREIELKNKPQSMINASPKGTVPVLILEDGTVIDESLDIMLYALKQNDPDGWLDCDMVKANQLIYNNDDDFKYHLDRYKYPERYDNFDDIDHKNTAETTLEILNNLLIKSDFLLSSAPCVADIALFPFIRQFAHVDKTWFYEAPYKALQRWLDHHLESSLFKSIMIKHTPWQEGDKPVYL